MGDISHSVFRQITCDECFEGLQKGVDRLLLESTMQGIVEALSGEVFCGNSVLHPDPERCVHTIEVLIPLALPALTTKPRSRSRSSDL